MADGSTHKVLTQEVEGREIVVTPFGTSTGGHSPSSFISGTESPASRVTSQTLNARFRALVSVHDPDPHQLSSIGHASLTPSTTNVSWPTQFPVTPELTLPRSDMIKSMAIEDGADGGQQICPEGVNKSLSWVDQVGEKVAVHISEEEEWNQQKWQVLDWRDRCLHRNTSKRMVRSAFNAWKEASCRSEQVASARWLSAAQLTPEMSTTQEWKNPLLADLQKAESRVKNLEALLDERQKQISAVQAKLVLASQEHLRTDNKLQGDLHVLQLESEGQQTMHDALAMRMLSLAHNLPSLTASTEIANSGSPFGPNTREFSPCAADELDADVFVLERDDERVWKVLGTTIENGRGFAALSDIKRLAKHFSIWVCRIQHFRTVELDRCAAVVKAHALWTWRKFLQGCAKQRSDMYARKVLRSWSAASEHRKLLSSAAERLHERKQSRKRRLVFARWEEGVRVQDSDQHAAAPMREGHTPTARRPAEAACMMRQREEVEALEEEVRRQRETAGVLEAGLAACKVASADEKRAAQRAAQERAALSRRQRAAERLELLARVARVLAKKRLRNAVRRSVLRWWGLRGLRRRVVEFLRAGMLREQRGVLARWRRRAFEAGWLRKREEWNDGRRERVVRRQSWMAWKQTRLEAHDARMGIVILGVRASVRRIVAHVRGWQRFTLRERTVRRRSAEMREQRSRARMVFCLVWWEECLLRRRIEGRVQQLAVAEHALASTAEELVCAKERCAELEWLVDEGRRQLRESEGERAREAEHQRARAEQLQSAMAAQHQEARQQRAAAEAVQAAGAASERAAAEEKKAMLLAEVQRSAGRREEGDRQRLRLLELVVSVLARKRSLAALRQSVLRWTGLCCQRRREESLRRFRRSTQLLSAMAAWRKCADRTRSIARECGRMAGDRMVGGARAVLRAWGDKARVLRELSASWYGVETARSLRRAVLACSCWRMSCLLAKRHRGLMRRVANARRHRTIVRVCRGWREAVDGQRAMGMVVQVSRQQGDIEELSVQLGMERKRADELEGLVKDGRRQYVSKEREVQHLEDLGAAREAEHQAETVQLQNAIDLQRERHELLVQDLQERMGRREAALLVSEQHNREQTERQCQRQRREWLLRAESQMVRSRARTTSKMLLQAWRCSVQARIRACNKAAWLGHAVAGIRRRRENAMRQWAQQAWRRRRSAQVLARHLRRRATLARCWVVARWFNHTLCRRQLASKLSAMLRRRFANTLRTMMIAWGRRCRRVRLCSSVVERAQARRHRMLLEVAFVAWFRGGWWEGEGRRALGQRIAAQEEAISALAGRAKAAEEERAQVQLSVAAQLAAAVQEQRRANEAALDGAERMWKGKRFGWLLRVGSNMVARVSRSTARVCFMGWLYAVKRQAVVRHHTSRATARRTRTCIRVIVQAWCGTASDRRRGLKEIRRAEHARAQARLGDGWSGWRSQVVDRRRQQRVLEERERRKNAQEMCACVDAWREATRTEQGDRTLTAWKGKAGELAAELQGKDAAIDRLQKEVAILGQCEQRLDEREGYIQELLQSQRAEADARNAQLSDLQAALAQHRALLRAADDRVMVDVGTCTHASAAQSTAEGSRTATRSLASDDAQELSARPREGWDESSARWSWALLSSLRYRGRAALHGWWHVVRTRRVRLRNKRGHAAKARLRTLRATLSRWRAAQIGARRQNIFFDSFLSRRASTAAVKVFSKWKEAATITRKTSRSVDQGAAIRRARILQGGVRRWLLWAARMGRFQAHGEASKLEEVSQRLQEREAEMEQRASELEREKMVRTEGIRILEQRIAVSRQQCLARELEQQTEAARLQQQLLAREETLTAARDHNCQLHGRARSLERVAKRAALLAWRCYLRCASQARALEVCDARRAERARAVAFVEWRWAAQLGSFEGDRATQHVVRVLAAYKAKALLVQVLTAWSRVALALLPCLPLQRSGAGRAREGIGSMERKRAVALAAREWVQWQRVMSFQQRFMANDGIRWINGLGLRAFCVWRGRAGKA